MCFHLFRNCDTISNETIKGDISKFKIKKQRLETVFLGKEKKTKLRNRLLFNEWNKTLDLSIEKEESPVDFKKNIKLLQHFVQKKIFQFSWIKSHANKNFYLVWVKEIFRFTNIWVLMTKLIH